MHRDIVSRLLFVIGIAHMIAGALIGLISTTMNVYYTGSGWSNFFVWTAGGFMAGMLFIGFAETIHLLRQINNKLGPASHRGEMLQYNTEDMDIADSEITRALDDDIKEAIYHLYSDESIVDVAASPKEDYSVVRFQNGREDYVRVVYTGGSEVEETNDASTRRSVIQWYNNKNV